MNINIPVSSEHIGSLIYSVFCEDNFSFIRCFFNGLLSEPTTYGYIEENFSKMVENNLKQIQNGISNCSIEGNGRIPNYEMYEWIP
jgi:hypothetical protein